MRGNVAAVWIRKELQENQVIQECLGILEFLEERENGETVDSQDFLDCRDLV